MGKQQSQDKWINPGASASDLNLGKLSNQGSVTVFSDTTTSLLWLSEQLFPVPDIAPSMPTDQDDG
jgi:hypothetical protein